MPDRKIEYSELSVRIIGTELREGESNAHRFTYAVDDIEALLDAIKLQFIDVATSVKNIDPSYSSKYQKIGIEKLQKKNFKGTNFYHFRLAYIKRNRDNIRVRDLDKSYKPRTIKLGATEYEYVPLHVSFVPSTRVILLDNRCHSAPTQQFLHQMFAPLLDYNEYGLSSADALDESLRVRVIPVKSKTFSQVLKKRLKTISQIGFTISKRRPMGGGIDPEVDNIIETKRVAGFLKKMAGSLLGKTYQGDILSSLPIKQVKLSLTFDESGDQKELTALKRAMSGRLEKIVESRIIRDSMLTYHDDETSKMQKMLFTGMSISKTNRVPEKDLNKSLKVWKEHRRIYLQTIKELNNQRKL